MTEAETIRANADSSRVAKKIVQDATRAGVTLRLLGGLAVRIHCHGPHSVHLRHYHDIDFFGLWKEAGKATDILRGFGYLPNVRFNYLYGRHRLQFLNPQDKPNVDIFLDEFRMEHTITFVDRLYLDAFTIPITDLLMTKLQIEKLTSNDVKDIVAILEDHQTAQTDDAERLNIEHVARLCSRDWGLYRSTIKSLGRVAKYVETATFEARNRKALLEKIRVLDDTINAKEKTLRWRLRSLLGERIKWYNEVETGEGERG